MDEFKRIILSMAPRILGFMDRDPKSATFGCCDRYYWHYKLHDVSNGRFQEVCLFLAMLYSYDFEGNIYYKNPTVKKYALAAISFWKRIIHSDGSVAEVYPFERSCCATAFSTFTVLEALFLLSALDQTVEFFKKIEKVGHWLIAHRNEKVTNQIAAAACALYNIGKYLDKNEFLAASEQKINAVVHSYQQDGYYTEYGGFDVGYTSITNSLMTWYSRHLARHPGLDMCVRDSQERIDRETLSDGNYYFKDKSRKTQFLYPYGFFVTQSPVFERILKGILTNTIITPLWLDDRYCIALSTDYLMTLHHSNQRLIGGEE